MNDGQQSRPAFAKGFPTDARVDALVAAFARGDYAQVRLAGLKLAQEATDDAVRQAALTLVERTSPDRLTKVLLALAAALLVLLSTYWIVHGKPPAFPGPHVEHVR